MYVVWGNRRVVRHRGYVAEFCPICRSIRPFRVRDVDMVPHLYFIPLGKGEHQAQKCTCTACRYTRWAEPFTYQAFVRERDADVSRLVQETRPSLLEELTERLVLEERLRGTGRPLGSDERLGLIAEPFYALSDQVQNRFRRETHIHTGAGLGVLATILLLAGFLLAGPILHENAPMSAEACVLAALTGLSLVGTIYLIATQVPRHIKRRVVPFIAKALAPVQPSATELADVIQRLRDRGLLIGKKLRPEWVLDAIRRAGARSLHDPLVRDRGRRQGC